MFRDFFFANTYPIIRADENCVRKQPTNIRPIREGKPKQSSSATHFVSRFAAYAADHFIHVDYGSHGFPVHKETNARKASYALMFCTGKLRGEAKNIRPLVSVNQHCSTDHYRQNQKWFPFLFFFKVTVFLNRLVLIALNYLAQWNNVWLLAIIVLEALLI